MNVAHLKIDLPEVCNKVRENSRDLSEGLMLRQCFQINQLISNGVIWDSTVLEHDMGDVGDLYVVEDNKQEDQDEGEGKYPDEAKDCSSHVHGASPLTLFLCFSEK